MSGTGRIVVGVTGSLASLAALRYASALARRDGVPLLAVLVWEPPEGEALYARMPDRSWARMWAEDARRRLEDAVVDGLGAVPAGVAFEGHVVRGTPAAALCRAADLPGDLLVVGSGPGRGRSAFARLRRRPVLRAVLKGAGCPVLTVPGPALLPGEARVLRRNARTRAPDRRGSTATGVAPSVDSPDRSA
ncbi:MULTISPECIES: universal stress protein [unclassified Streptomyces]|uniref:universal stress protein n=1 Tax=unclassified Streptomyces TaxID=2593676 RepID=UPI001655D146|nr:universal stress protein [Streptomyces sp. CB02980]MCB8905169.1 universal stress protein [Streptomyces sp. CB02980]